MGLLAVASALVLTLLAVVVGLAGFSASLRRSGTRCRSACLAHVWTAFGWVELVAAPELSLRRLLAYALVAGLSALVLARPSYRP